MSLRRVGAVCIALLFLGSAANRALAQTKQADAKIDKDVDLPVEAAAPAGQKEKPPAPPDSPPPPTDTPPTFYGKDLTSESGTIFFVIDISGSMSWGDQPFVRGDGSLGKGSRLDRAKVELTRAILGLPKTFKFDILAYDCSVDLWQESLMPANDATKTKAISWVDDLQPRGGTGTGPAVVKALQIRENKLIVLLTDGGPNCGAGDGKWGNATFEAHRQMIAGANSQKAVINVFGIGANQPEMRTFCLEVASDSGGSYTDVP